MKTIQQKIMKYLLFILVLGLFTNGCFCPSPDYTEEIEETLNTVSQSLEDFHTKNQRWPNTSERNKILENRGCLFGNKGENYCKKAGVWFEVETDLSLGPPYQYSLFLSYKKVFCRIELSKKGKKRFIHPRCDDTCGNGWGA